MEEIPVVEAEQARLERRLGAARKALIAFPNVHNVDVGLELSGGVPTGRLAFRAHVAQKVGADALDEQTLLPEEFEGIPVDVIQYNPQPQAARNSMFDPVIGGIQVRNPKLGGAGTLGMVVLDWDSLAPYALSNAHVMVRTPAVKSDVIVQPWEPNTLGTVARYSKQLDCAIASIGNRNWSLEVYGSDPIIGAVEPHIGTKVYKSGLTTGVTWGVIDGVDAQALTIVPYDPAMGEMSLPGDSGSIWRVVPNGQAVGLHFAGNDEATDPNERASAKRILAVARELKVLIFDGLAISTARIGGGCRVVAKTAPGAACSIVVRYPSGRRSTAKGLQPKTADGNGWVEWSWTVGTSTARKAGRDNVDVEVTLGGTVRRTARKLEGTTDWSH